MVCSMMGWIRFSFARSANRGVSIGTLSARGGVDTLGGGAGRGAALVALVFIGLLPL